MPRCAFASRMASATLQQRTAAHKSSKSPDSPVLKSDHTPALLPVSAQTTMSRPRPARCPPSTLAGLLALGSRCGTKVDAAAAIAREFTGVHAAPSECVCRRGTAGRCARCNRRHGLPDRCVAGLSQPRVGVDVKRRASCSELRALSQTEIPESPESKIGAEERRRHQHESRADLASARQCSAYRLVPATISAAVMPARKRASTPHSGCSGIPALTLRVRRPGFGKAFGQHPLGE